METSAVGVKQAIMQSAIATSMVKQNAKAEQAVAQMVAASADRGQNLDISV